jgi:hypothetical protein
MLLYLVILIAVVVFAVDYQVECARRDAAEAVKLLRDLSSSISNNSSSVNDEISKLRKAIDELNP